MKALLLYGFHIEEHDFGKDVWGEYVRCFNPDPVFLEAITLQNPAHRHNCSEEELAQQELVSLALEHNPDVIIDIHHSKSLPDAIKRRVKQRANRLWDFWYDLTESILFEPIEHKLLYSIYWNPEVDKGLSSHLPRKGGFGRVIARHTSDTSGSHSILTREGIAEITVEARLNCKDGKPIHDEYYLRNVERLVQMLHGIYEYCKSN